MNVIFYNCFDIFPLSRVSLYLWYTEIYTFFQKTLFTNHFRLLILGLQQNYIDTAGIITVARPHFRILSSKSGKIISQVYRQLFRCHHVLELYLSIFKDNTPESFSHTNILFLHFTEGSINVRSRAKLRLSK